MWNFQRLQRDSRWLHVAFSGRGSLEPHIIFFNGRTEYAEKYSYLPKDLGLSPDAFWLSWDHCGQGQSSGLPGHIENYQTYIKDAEFIIKNTLPSDEYIIIAHSMGALIAIYGTILGVFKPQQLICTSPFLAPYLPPPLRVAGTALARGLYKLGLGQLRVPHNGRIQKQAFENNLLTHSKERYRSMQERGSENASFAWLAASTLCQQQVWRLANRLSCPLRLILAGEDKVVDNAAVYNWIGKVRSKVDVHVIPGAKHELFAESDEFYLEVVRQVRAVLPESVFAKKGEF